MKAPKLDDSQRHGRRSRARRQGSMTVIVEKICEPERGAKLDAAHRRAFAPSEDESDEGAYFSKVRIAPHEEEGDA